jgi:hypothetical protein
VRSIACRSDTKISPADPPGGTRCTADLGLYARPAGRALCPCFITLLLSPRAGAVDRQEDTPGCHRGPTEELVPLADVFVASISATIRWALALGIPVINYDCYRYRYGDYAGASGMVLVEDEAAFAAALREICLDPKARNGLGDQAGYDSVNWDCIDGRFTERFVELLRRVSRAPADRISLPR